MIAVNPPSQILLPGLLFSKAPFTWRKVVLGAYGTLPLPPGSLVESVTIT